MIVDVIKVFIPAITAFWIGIAGTPLVTHYLYAFKVWKKKTSKIALDGTEATEFARLRNEVHTGTETSTPRMGGIVIWGAVALTAGLYSLWAVVAPSNFSTRMEFISRSQTWIPLVTLLIGAFVGFINDVLDVVETKQAHGLPLSVRLSVVTLLSLFVGSWFFVKLGIVAIGIPFFGALYLGWGIVPLFIFISLCLYASGVIDGIDGLSGGVFASIFGAYAFIAFSNGQFDLAAFCATVVGGLLAFLWFNVPPARFWMTETGSMALTITIAAVAFLTDLKGEGNGVFVLPIVGALLVATVASNVLQVFWKKFFKRKLFRIAPLHHHFEAIGWPPYKVTMRYWILSFIFAIMGVAVALVG
jgi:phospho-N-acetylmuramoyl-pentapeptide-transferase